MKSDNKFVRAFTRGTFHVLPQFLLHSGAKSQSVKIIDERSLFHQAHTVTDKWER
jgi:hypothetical protein